MDSQIPEGAIPAEEIGGGTDAIPEGAIPADQAQSDEDKYGTPGQQLLTGVEGASHGLLGPVATLAEKGLSAAGVEGLSPQEQEIRANVNPWTHGLSEAAGFGAGMLTGTGEAGLLAKTGEGIEGLTAAGKAAQALKAARATNNLAKIAEAKAAVDAVPLAAKLGTSAAKGAAEMALLGTGDEATKYINDAPQSVGGALTHVGYSALGGGLINPLLTGTGLAVRKGIASMPEGLATFIDRLKYRMTGAEPGDAVHKELSTALDTLDKMNDEVYGAIGLKSEAISKLVPELNPKMQSQMDELGGSLTDKFAKMDAEPDRYPPVLVRDLKNEFFNWKKATVDNPAATSEDMFNATNKLKQTLQGMSKFERQFTPLTAEGRFIAHTKDLGLQVRQSLEDSKVWGDAADVQKQFNEAYSGIKDYHKQVLKAFTGKVGDSVQVLPEKVNSYLKNGTKYTEPSLRQQQLGGFVDKFQKYQKSIGDISEKAGIENPIAPVGTGALEESLQKTSPWTKAADTWYDKSMSEAGGALIGSGLGGYLGEKSGIPGLGWAGFMLGGTLGRSVLPAMIQPMMEKAVNARAFQTAIEFGERAVKGDKLINDSAANLFKAGGMSSMRYAIPDDEKLDKIDEQVQAFNNNPQQLLNNTSNLNHYMAPQAQETMAMLGRTAQYLHTIKPQATQASALDTKIEPSKAEVAAYRRQLSLVEQPLQVMQHIKNGTLQPQDVATIKTVSPALHDQIAKAVQTEMVDHVQGGGSVPYPMKQSLSLFLEQPLDSTLTPMGILAMQQTYASTGAFQPKNGIPAKTQKNTSKLGKTANSYKTPSQEAEGDRANRH